MPKPEQPFYNVLAGRSQCQYFPAPSPYVPGRTPESAFLAEQIAHSGKFGIMSRWKDELQ